MIDPQFFDLIKHLGRSGSYQHFWTPDGDDGKKLSRWFACNDPPPELPAGWETKNVYFSVNSSNLRRSEHEKIHNTDVEAINCLYAEFDCSTGKEKQHILNTVRRWRYAPGCIVDSGGGIHAYVLLDKSFVLTDKAYRTEAALLQRAWVHFVSADLTVHDLARVLRVPGTTNFKPEYGPNFPTVSILNFSATLTHSLDDIRQTLQPTIDGWQTKKAHSNRQQAAGGTVSLDDQQLLDVMFAGNNGVKYQSLWNGDLSVCNDDHSACDQMLCNALAYYTQRDEQRIDSLFRQSGLFRDKWRDRDDYRQRTLQNAIDSTHSIYTGVNGNGDSDAVKAAQAAIGLGSQHSSNGAGNSAPNAGQTGGKNSKLPGWPYEIKDKMLLFHRFDKALGQYIVTAIADFTATIVEQVTMENGERVFVVEGEGKRGGSYRTEIAADSFGDTRKLSGILEASVGALDTIYAGMSRHLGPAIKKLTDKSRLKSVQRFVRTGWRGDDFLIPGREPTGIEIVLPEKLPYQIKVSCDGQMALDALENLLESIVQQKTSVLLSHILVPPAAKLGGWENERTGLFINGRTGSFKTSTAQCAMSIYGGGFFNDRSLLKWGEGATNNAIMFYAAAAHDMPFLIDNYKPSTGGGERAFIGLIHNILEGGEKERLNRSAALRSGKSISCWPLVTGEDLPRSDAASLARILVIEYGDKKHCNIDRLTALQATHEQMEGIGIVWIDWLQGNAGREVVEKYGVMLPEIRNRWANYLKRQQISVANPYRIGTNLAINELAFHIACEHPLFGPLLRQYQHQHFFNLEDIANRMANETATALEANRFLVGLRELVTGGKGLLLNMLQGSPATSHDADRLIGWRETDNSIYLLPATTRQMIERASGERFSSLDQLYGQLEDLGLIKQKSAGARTRTIRINNQVVRVLHLTEDALDPKAGNP